MKIHVLAFENSNSGEVHIFSHHSTEAGAHAARDEYLKNKKVKYHNAAQMGILSTKQANARFEKESEKLKVFQYDLHE